MELLERDHDLQTLVAAFDEVVAGRGRIALVSGEAGIGKTSFVDHFLLSRGERVCALKGNCDPLFTPTPFGPLHDIARQVGGSLPAQLEGATARAALFAGILDRLAKSLKPVVLVIEDVHWADDATLDLIKYLSRRVAQVKVLLIVTYRDDEVASRPPLRLLLGDLAASRATVRIGLPRFSIDAVRTLIAGRALDAAAVLRQTSGNPFFVTEVLSSATTGLPATVRDAVLARVASLTPAGRRVLDAAAVVGSRIDHGFLEQVLEGKAQDRMAGLAECTRAGMLETASDGLLVFRHELMREAVLTDLDPARFRELSRRAFDVLRRSDSLRADAAQLVEYAQGAGDADSVIEYGLRAGRTASAVGAHREAAAQYARVLEHAGSRTIEERAGYCEAYAEECAIVDLLPQAEGARRQAIELWRQAGNTLKEGENLAELAWPLVRSGRNDAADETIRHAIEVLQGLAPSPQLANALRVQAHLRMLYCDKAVAVRTGKQAIELARRFGDKVTIAATENVIGSALLVAGDDKGEDHLLRSMALAREAGLDSHVGIGFANLGGGFGEQYRFVEAERYLTEGIAYTGERDLDYTNHYMHAWLALTRLYQGRWTEAADIAGWVLQRPTSTISRIVALSALGRVRARRGDPGTAEILDEALALASQTNSLLRVAPVRAARAEAAWLTGDSRASVNEATAAYELVVRYRHRWHAGELIHWRRLGGDMTPAPTWCAQPFLLQVRGQWRRAAAIWQRLGCPYEHAAALADGDSAAQLEALEIFTQLGAAPAAALLRQRMRGAGMRRIPRGPRATTRQNPFGLTAREMEILGCLTKGLTNGRIGATLHVSPKTVDHHVSSVLAKLGAASRGEASRIALEKHLLAPPPASQHGEVLTAK